MEDPPLTGAAHWLSPLHCDGPEQGLPMLPGGPETPASDPPGVTTEPPSAAGCAPPSTEVVVPPSAGVVEPASGVGDVMPPRARRAVPFGEPRPVGPSHPVPAVHI